MSKIVGKEKVDYLSKKTNQQVNGVRLHVLQPDNKVEGYAAEAVFISSKHASYDAVANLPLGSEIIIIYNRFGSVQDIQIVSAGDGTAAGKAPAGKA